MAAEDDGYSPEAGEKERDIGDHVHEIGDAEPGATVSEIVVALWLRDAMHQGNTNACNKNDGADDQNAGLLRHAGMVIGKREFSKSRVRPTDGDAVSDR